MTKEIANQQQERAPSRSPCVAQRFVTWTCRLPDKHHGEHDFEVTGRDRARSAPPSSEIAAAEQRSLERAARIAHAVMEEQTEVWEQNGGEEGSPVWWGRSPTTKEWAQQAARYSGCGGADAAEDIETRIRALLAGNAAPQETPTSQENQGAAAPQSPTVCVGSGLVAIDRQGETYSTSTPIDGECGICGQRVRIDNCGAVVTHPYRKRGSSEPPPSKSSESIP